MPTGFARVRATKPHHPIAESQIAHCNSKVVALLLGKQRWVSLTAKPRGPGTGYLSYCLGQDGQPARNLPAECPHEHPSSARGPLRAGSDGTPMGAGKSRVPAAATCPTQSVRAALVLARPHHLQSCPPRLSGRRGSGSFTLTTAHPGKGRGSSHKGRGAAAGIPMYNHS